MRVADKMLFNQVSSNLAKNRQQMSELQNQAASQKRLTKPSDDPVAASRVLASRVDLAGNQQYLKSLEYARSFLEFTDQSLSEVSENLMRAKELALSQANDASANEVSRRVTAAEVEQIYDQIVQIGNRKLGDRFIFGGFKTTTPPFALSGEYRGDGGQMRIPTDKGAFVVMNLPGERVFLGRTQEEAPFERGGAPRPLEEEALNLRGPASLGGAAHEVEELETLRAKDQGVSLFRAVRQLEVGLRTNDKETIQDSLVLLDEALSQVVMARAEAGSRVSSLDNVFHSLHQARVDNQIAISQMEDADIFSVVSDMNKTESTLQATLATSGKLIQPSLLDFLR